MKKTAKTNLIAEHNKTEYVTRLRYNLSIQPGEPSVDPFVDFPASRARSRAWSKPVLRGAGFFFLASWFSPLPCPVVHLFSLMSCLVEAVWRTAACVYDAQNSRKPLARLRLRGYESLFGHQLCRETASHPRLHGGMLSRADAPVTFHHPKLRGQRRQPVGWPIFNVYQPPGCPRAAIFQALSGTLLAHGHAQSGMSVGSHHAPAARGRLCAT